MSMNVIFNEFFKYIQSWSSSSLVQWFLHALTLSEAVLQTGWPENYQLKDGDRFDFIVVGSGSAGAVVAARLSDISESRAFNVLLIEAGGDPPPSSVVPKGWDSAHQEVTNATSSQCSEVPEYEATKMPPRIQAPCRLLFLMQMRSIKFFFIVSCTSFALSLFWAQLVTRQDHPAVTENFVQEALENVGRDYRYKDVYRKTTRLPKDFKYILLWTRSDFAPFYYFGDGQRAFLKNNCSVIKCYVTANRKFFGGDLTKFDAIAFNGRNLNPHDLPRVRARHQKYIYFTLESPSNYPICSERFEGFFNWTATYRLDSDIPSPYILIRDSKGEIVGPKQKMRWNEMEVVGDEFVDKIRTKKKAAAWFVSNCKSRAHRTNFVQALDTALKSYGMSVDVYGKCGNLQCHRNQTEYCNDMLARDYFFYMSLENSFHEDYVTEKLLRAMQYNVIPIVYGGADYSRFIPPGTYIDSRKYSIDELVELMIRLIQSPKEYSQYFWWKNHYTFHDPTAVENVCAVCQALHDEKMLQKTTVYDDFRAWWYPLYKRRCPSGFLSVLYSV